MLFELGLKAFLQSEGIGCGAGKACENLLVIEAADLAGGRLDDDIAQSNLPISAERDLIAASDADDGGSVKLFHGVFPLKGLDGGANAQFKGNQELGASVSVEFLANFAPLLSL